MNRLPIQLVFVLGGLWLDCHSIPAEEPKREQIGQVLGKPVYRDHVMRKGSETLADQVHNVFYRPVMRKYFTDHRADLEFTDEELTFAAYVVDEAEVDRDNSQLQPDADTNARKKTIRNELEDIATRLATDNLTVEERAALLKQKADTEKRFKGRREVVRTMTSAQWAERFFMGPKLSRHLYEQYGGGRVIVTKFGVLAFDALQRWLKERESLGEFEITDPQIREAVIQAKLDQLALWEKRRLTGGTHLSDKPEDIQHILKPSLLPEKKVPSVP